MNNDIENGADFGDINPDINPDVKAGDGLDEAIQRELNEALNDMGAESFVDTEGAERQGPDEQIQRGKVIAIHGDVHRLRCTRCRWRDGADDLSGLPALPTCPRCAAVIRPDVVLFGEMLPEEALAELARELREGFDVVFSVGTSSLFPYIVRPVLDARARGISTVEVNPGETEVSLFVDHRIRTGAVVAFEALWDAFEAKTRRA